MTRLLVIVPSRGRPGNVERLRNAIRDTAVLSPDIVVCLDDDDEANYPRLDDVTYMISPRKRLAEWQNAAAAEHAHAYDYLALFGDDVVPETPGWDALLIAGIEHLPFGVAYGDDGIQHAGLPTHPIVPSSMYEALGWIALPGIKHLYLDNVWKALGEATGTLYYDDFVKIPHLHRNLGLAPADRTYFEANDTEQAEYDRLRFEEWLGSSEYEESVSKLQALR